MPIVAHNAPHAQPPASSPGAAAAFDWPLAAEAETLLRDQRQQFLDRNSFARSLARRMRDETGTDFFEWIDHLVLPAEVLPAVQAAGFMPAPALEVPAGHAAYELPRATLPRVLVRTAGAGHAVAVALRPESLLDFIACQNLGVEPEGEPWSRYRRVIVAEENGTRLEAIERRAYRGFLAGPLTSAGLRARLKARELCRVRPRRCQDEAEGFRLANVFLDRVLELVGPDLACEFWFEAERAYWQSRNHAARVQKHRQDLLGLGWGNHDHHTFRSSRAHFVDLVQFLLRLGFVKRERYYAGAEAGWGAQVLEQPVTGIVVFADVDLAPEETQVDFSAVRRPPTRRLGTVGLWVGLHGESFLEAGMHHLEARFEFDQLRDQLKARGIDTMTPFSDFPFLRQAFTAGERWPVRRERLERLLASGLITPPQFEQFLAEGTLGSHLENLERHAGFKGFNQKSVSAIIAATDPRRHGKG